MPQDQDQTGAARREGQATGGWLRPETILLAAGLLFILWTIGDVFLLVFAAVVLAIGLDGLAVWLADKTPLRRGWTLLMVSIAIVAVLVGLSWSLAPQVAAQFAELWEQLVALGEDAAAWITDGGLPTEIAAGMEDGEQILGIANDMIAFVASFGLTTFAAVTSLLVMIVLAAFLAADPALYRRGLLRLVPPRRRPLIAETLGAVAHALRWWFLAQLASMAVLGVSIGAGLYVIGIDLWLGLAVLTALLTFVPYLGPVIAGIPTVAIGFAEGTQTGLIVLVFFLVVQNIESNVIVPLIYHKAIHLAPAVTIAAQVLLGLVFGLAGFILAAPVTVLGMVLVQKLYVEAVLGEET